jgi:hypothetical protein
VVDYDENDPSGYTPPWEDSMTTAPTHLSGPVVTEMSQGEWKIAVDEALARLQLTYQQLADMARRREFSSVEAHKLWVSIGDSER